MSDVAIRVENLSKQYKIGATLGHDRLKDLLTHGLGNLFSRNSKSEMRNSSSDYIWALKDVSFEVEQGEILGIIGRNGAGKTTLLKVLSRITEPTSGRAVIFGRVRSLLEVGTGFDRELTGRENIYLSGAILGMTKCEIDRKFDEIVEFSGVEKFIDTPVKRYSSGMYVRLAFSVAAHLEPEILLVDEVLAVGDAAFQRKCLGKMDDVTTQGRTVLFVSHNMNAIQRLCNRVLMLDGGRTWCYGDTKSVTSKYLSVASPQVSPNKWSDLANACRRGTGEVRFASIRYSSLNEDVGFQPFSNGPLEVSVIIDSDASRTVESVSFTIYDRLGTKLVNADSIILGRNISVHTGDNTVTFRLERLHLNPGTYDLGLWMADGGNAILDYIESAIEIEVVDLQSSSFGMKPLADGLVTCSFDVITT